MVEHFFLDWKFWSVVVSLVAIVLSQLPPIHLIVRPRRLEVELHSRVQLAHRAGNPNVSIVVGVNNSGGRDLNIRSMHIELKRDGQQLASLPAQAYFESPSSTSSVLLVPFSLKPGEQWTHSVNFFKHFERQVEKEFRGHLSRLKSDIRQKLNNRPSDNKDLVEAEPELVGYFERLFNSLFIWRAGEYVLSLKVTAEPGSASYSKDYRFTVYESDFEELRAQVDRYKYGAWIAYDEQDPGVSIPLTVHVG